MTFDNSKTIISIRIKLFVATVLFLAYILLTYAAGVIKFPLLGISETGWTIILTACYLVVVFLPMYLSYQYIYFSDDDEEKIIIRYFNAGIMGGRKNSVEIRKKLFSGFQVDKKFFGLIKSITLYQQTKQGKAKYPPVYISALNREQIARVTRSLNSYLSGPV
jgi:hypothetical protein